MTELTFDERLSLTQHVFNLLDGWGLAAREIATLLGLADSVKLRHLMRFRHNEPLPDEPQINRRLDYLVRIEQALQTYFPRNPEMRRVWIKRVNRKLGERSPMAVMFEEGESGMISVLSHLDCTFAWDLTGSSVQYQHG